MKVILGAWTALKIFTHFVLTVRAAEAVLLDPVGGPSLKAHLRRKTTFLWTGISTFDSELNFKHCLNTLKILKV